jgi:DNA-directed RNA polymerase I, II, and III subunit RPABC2
MQEVDEYEKSDIESVNGGEGSDDESDVLSQFSGMDLNELDGGGGSEIEDYDSMDEEEDMDEEGQPKGTTAAAAADIDEKAYDSDEDEDDDEEDDDYLQKLDDNFRQKIIENHHPELKTLNYEEIETLATVVRDRDSTIIDPLHRTLPVLTRYEKARILGERAKQINMGAKPFVDVDESMIDGYLIALKELDQKLIPFIIQRPLPHGGSEYWRIADLEVLA